ncbi:hypothetical protein OZX65_00920 [Leuconostocaceae bacterium ESL0723]|nr:hypothetical protein OZX65_00920 [Leuconostocaceae bacterium ESL0723]
MERRKLTYGLLVADAILAFAWLWGAFYKVLYVGMYPVWGVEAHVLGIVSLWLITLAAAFVAYLLYKTGRNLDQWASLSPGMLTGALVVFATILPIFLIMNYQIYFMQ